MIASIGPAVSHPDDIVTLLHREIPLSKEMGIAVLEASEARVSIRAPLTPNINYSGTGFGGSLYSVAVLSAWLLLRMSIVNGGLDFETLVIQSGQADYLIPVEESFEGVASWIDDDARTRFLSGLVRHRQFRTNVAAQIICRDRTCAKFSGRFVARVRQTG